MHLLHRMFSLLVKDNSFMSKPWNYKDFVLQKDNSKCKCQWIIKCFCQILFFPKHKLQFRDLATFYQLADEQLINTVHELLLLSLVIHVWILVYSTETRLLQNVDRAHQPQSAWIVFGNKLLIFGACLFVVNHYKSQCAA